MSEGALTFRRFKDGDNIQYRHSERIVVDGYSHKCPTYIHRTPPCQGSCPSGHDIRGWLSIVRGLDKPASGMSWQEYAFRRMAEANPFPAIMGRVCPAPCQDGCNRNMVEEHVGINSVEQFVGDWAIANKITFSPPTKETGKKVAVIGGGPGGLAAAYFLRCRGHAVTIFESYASLGGMMRFGIPGYRTPKDVLDAEIQRILDMGVEIRLNTRVGTDIPMSQLEKDFDSIFWAIGAQSGNTLGIAGGEASNCVSGVSFLRAFNENRLQHLHGRVLVIGGGDTAMDVAAVARRIGHIDHVSEKDRPENVILGYTAHDVASVARREGADVWIIYRRHITKMPATQHELDSVQKEGVLIKESLVPLEVICDPDGRATALRVMPVEWEGNTMIPHQDKAFNIDCTLIVSAVGQGGDFTGIESLNNGRGLISADRFYRVSSHKGHFVGGDVIKPHLLTTAIGHARIACESIDTYLGSKELERRPKVDVHHFNLLGELHSRGLEPEPYQHGEVWGTNAANFAVHNFEDRSAHEIVTHERMFLGHFQHSAMNRRSEVSITEDEVLGNFRERFANLDEKKAVDEAKRCMSCGLCFECDECVIYCPQIAIYRVKKKERAMGRYVDTDYAKCIGCHICMDVCPSGYIQMGMGEE
ncbi:Protein similar to glutamate synthase [NADPH] small chain, clustered with sulfite reductase [invertebrate metagenome]|uniref:Protein similar to glutamate synthase [NADPH] small chain, clustered with sulfite reductase n=1 Tax=invertebrate metagenome TaxID=1711999 RepID=A0A484H6W6_9ZZZZ